MRRAHLAIGIAVLLALAGAATGLASVGSRDAARSATASISHLAPAKGGSFLSLWPACACGRRTWLDQFSLGDGRRLRRLTRVRVVWPEHLATPSVDRAGRVWMTFNSGGPKCTNDTSTCGPVPDSCSGRLERLNLGTGSDATMLTFARSQLVTDAIPDPHARQVVMVQGGCVTSFFNQHLVVRDMRSGREWSLGADAAPCHELDTPSWSPNGRKLVFAYGPSRLRKGTPDTPNSCVTSKFNRLVIVSSQHASSTSSWKLIRAQRQCSYEAAAFDQRGVAAVEACAPAGQGLFAVDSGRPFLVQLNYRGRVVEKLALKTGWNGGSIATDQNGNVLVSQYKPTRSDWVWQFNGRVLRLVARYRADDAAQVLAVPTAAP